ncbi:MAG: hydroxyphenylacetyl-CoA thioesterase PaaI [Rhodanobacteraceae bacterium]
MADERDATGDGGDSSVSARDLAQRTGRHMYARDHASQGLGMVLETVSPGRACLSMRVRADMLNGHGTCHGGFIFALADSAFAFACNSRNAVTVASACHIDFIRPGAENDLLRAEAVERSLVGRSGVYDIAVSNQRGELVALFRGKSRRIRGEVVTESVRPSDPDAGAGRAMPRSATRNDNSRMGGT